MKDDGKISIYVIYQMKQVLLEVLTVKAQIDRLNLKFAN
jgi:hypothetical protein